MASLPLTLPPEHQIHRPAVENWLEKRKTRHIAFTAQYVGAIITAYEPTRLDHIVVFLTGMREHLTSSLYKRMI